MTSPDKLRPVRRPTVSVDVGGTITGEHGVGIEKVKQMCVQFSREELDAFHAVKAAFDPLGVLNPGRMTVGT